MPRAIWSGTISFGLVSIPVKLYNAVSRKSVSFNQLERSSGSRIRYRKVSADTGEEVPAEEIVKGYDLGGGAYVTLTDEELAGLDPKAERTIDLAEFVDLADIDPIFYDSAYYLAPDQHAKPYALLTRAMGDADKVAIGRFVMRSKQYLCAIRAQDGHLLLSTMAYADEIADPAAIPEMEALEAVEVDDKEVAMASQLIESLAAPFEPERFHDTHREAVLELIDRKAAGEEVVTPAASAEPDKVVDLMAALEASVAAAKEARVRHPTAKDPDEAESGREASEADDADQGAEAAAESA